MKFTIPREDLSGALSRVKALCSGATTLPILGCMLLKTEGETLTITGNNLDHCLAITLPAQVEKPGEVAVSGARLTAAVARMEADDATISVEKKGKQLVCAGGGMSVTLFAYPTEEFPPAPQLSDEGKPVVLTGGVLAKALAKVLPFVSADTTRYVLCGVCFCGDDTQLKLIGTDGRRLICVELGVEAAQSVIVPTAAAKLLIELDTAGDVELRMSATLLVARGANWLLHAKIIEGIYPSWRSVVPGRADGKRRLTVGRKALLTALPFVGVVLPERTSAVVLESGDGELRVQTRGPEVGEATATLEAETEGCEVKVSYNASYLADALRVLTGEQVTLAMMDEMSPTRIDEPGTVAVLMPMRIS